MWPSLNDFVQGDQVAALVAHLLRRQEIIIDGGKLRYITVMVQAWPSSTELVLPHDIDANIVAPLTLALEPSSKW
jgi:hypothetical protein